MTLCCTAFSECNIEQLEWLLISDNVNDDIGLIVNPSINTTYVIWSEYGDNKVNTIWESYLPYEYDNKYIVQANKLGYNIDSSVLGYNPLMYEDKINPSIMVYLKDNTINILLSNTFNIKLVNVYSKNYNSTVKDLSITPDYETIVKSRNWLLCYNIIQLLCVYIHLMVKYGKKWKTIHILIVQIQWYILQIQINGILFLIANIIINYIKYTQY